MKVQLMASALRSTDLFILLLALAFVFHPLAVDVETIADSDPVYERTPLTVTDDTLDWERGTAAVAWHGLDCFEDPEDHRRCLLERSLVGSPLVVDSPPGIMFPDDRYVALPSGTYRRARSETANGTTIALEPVGLPEVIDDIAVPPEGVPSRLEPAATGRKAVLEDRIEETYVVEDGGQYYLITRTDIERPALGENYGLYSFLLQFVGVLSVFVVGKRVGEGAG